MDRYGSATSILGRWNSDSFTLTPRPTFGRPTMIPATIRRLALLIGSAFVLTSAPALADVDACPYVRGAPAGGWVIWKATDARANPRTTAELVKAGDAITVPAADSRPSFQVTLQPLIETADSAEIVLPENVSVFLLADTHGEFEICTELLINQYILTPDLKWSFGTGHLVITGDVFDRGPRHTELLWLFYKLEIEAKHAGGAVHMLLGNHETMVLTGDLRYLHSKYPESAKALGVANYSELFAKDTLLGQWLRTKPAMLRLGRALFLHGGVSADLTDAKLSLGDINATIRDWLNGDKPKTDPGVALITGPTGPLWYRGYFPKYRVGGHGAPKEVEDAKKWFGVERIAVGHTIVSTVTPLYDGSVVAVQVYPTKDQTTGQMNMEGVYIDEQGVWHKAKIDGTREQLKNDKGEVIRNPPPMEEGNKEPEKKAA